MSASSLSLSQYLCLFKLVFSNRFGNRTYTADCRANIHEVTYNHINRMFTLSSIPDKEEDLKAST